MLFAGQDAGASQRSGDRYSPRSPANSQIGLDRTFKISIEICAASSELASIAIVVHFLTCRSQQTPTRGYL